MSFKIHQGNGKNNELAFDSHKYLCKNVIPKSHENTEITCHITLYEKSVPTNCKLYVNLYY